MLISVFISDILVSIFQTVDSLKLKLLQNKVQMNRANELMMQLQNVINHISEDNNRIENLLRPCLLGMMQYYSSLYPESLLLPPSGSNSGIAQSTYFPHISSPVDTTFAECDSFLGFSNTNNVIDTRNDNVGFVNGQTWNQQGLVYPQMPESNPASVAFQNAMEEKGKFPSSVMDTGSLPMWHQPTPQGPQYINFARPPPLTIKDIDMADMGNRADLLGDSFVDSMLNLTELHSDPWIHGQVSGSKRQRLY
ncbi:hypothetical protein K1719_045630 [Acacia pycnantha]|nr:hypothetical protein K1719_045630 [Acacia pycnantha]